MRTGAPYQCDGGASAARGRGSANVAVRCDPDMARRNHRQVRAPDDQRFEALRWILFDNHKFTANYAMHRFQNALTPEPVHPALLSFLRSRVEASFAIVDKHLMDRPFVLGELPTIVDFSMAGYVYYPPEET